MTQDWAPRAATPLAHIGLMADAYSRGSRDALWSAMDDMARPVLGQQLLTVHQFDAPNMRLTRLYSSNQTAYPPGGSKSKAGMPWGEHVLIARRIFVGEGPAAIAQAFDDHDAIAALGLRSVINVPVVVRETCLGTVNFLMTRDVVSQDDVAFAQMLALLAVPAFTGAVSPT